VVFTSHRWNEITSIADRITVCRNGRQVGTFPATTLDEDQAVTLMTGRRVETLYPPVPPLPADAPNALTVAHLAAPRIHDVSLALHAGEILGIGGARPSTSGSIDVAGRRVTLKRPRDAIRHRIALVPEDRKTEGLLLEMSVRDNATLAILGRLSRLGLLRRGRERRLSDGVVTSLKVKTAGPHAPVGSLSGGNQQKVLLGRWLLAEPRVLLLYDVTRGVDVATKAEIYALIFRLAAEGRAILLYSSDAEELAHLTHRVLVMREGRIAAELASPTAEDIVSASVRDAA
jgi:ribose transport system ATP-binding protein